MRHLFWASTNFVEITFFRLFCLGLLSQWSKKPNKLYQSFFPNIFLPLSGGDYTPFFAFIAIPSKATSTIIVGRTILFNVALVFENS